MKFAHYELLWCEFYGDLIIIYLARSYGFVGERCLCASCFFSVEKKEFNARKNFVVRGGSSLWIKLSDFMGYQTS
jgi:hypothetical protein